MTTEREEKIRQRAHQIWESEGRPHGQHDQHWERARGEVDREAADQPSEAAQMDSMRGVSADPAEASAGGRRTRKASAAQGEAATKGPARTTKSRGTGDGSGSTTSAAGGRKRTGPREVTSEGTKPDGAPPAQGRAPRRGSAKGAAEDLGSGEASADAPSSSAEGAEKVSRRPRKSSATQDQ